ncbi:Protein of unknown function (DUF2806) [Herbaspirillum sp. CF444]|uniref:DUF2806 domain-containing protein n=1 Tax=Herbaspirillum sp. CF444 TaxID=1144319 RepID=UPI0002727E1C|nr:DUF2806 domain-containing protein [Herbaspirillum sp. CF444]EJL93509.1 Protein of unknown function (DUF2806) [Herbaspirillum sp. CF444]
MDDLLGLSKPAEKIIEVVSAGIGTLYRPRAMRKEADAKAYEILKIGEANRKNALEERKAEAQMLMLTDQAMTPEMLALAERAKQRLLHREVKRQANLEAIADYALAHAPLEVPETDVNPQWRDRFFQHAEDVSLEELQEIWGKILSKEVSKPGTFSLRTLEILSNLSATEAQLFERFSRLLVFGRFALKILVPINPHTLDFDFETDIVQSDGDLNFEHIIQLQHANLIHAADLSLPIQLDQRSEAERVGILRFNDIWLRLRHQTATVLNFGAYRTTQAGEELLKLIPPRPNKKYLTALKTHIKPQGVTLDYGVAITPAGGLIGNFREIEELPEE